MEEIWKTVKEYPNYQISNFGNIKSIDRMVKTKGNKMKLSKGKKLKLNTRSGYYYTNLYNKNGNKKVLIHRLVAEAFIPNPNNLPQVNHKDENKLNNNVNNLEWCSRSYNMNYGTRNKRVSKIFGISINQYDLNGNFIKKWDCIADARRYYNSNHIGECCKGYLKSCCGFIWKYADSI